MMIVTDRKVNGMALLIIGHAKEKKEIEKKNCIRSASDAVYFFLYLYLSQKYQHLTEMISIFCPSVCFFTLPLSNLVNIDNITLAE